MTKEKSFSVTAVKCLNVERSMLQLMLAWNDRRPWISLDSAAWLKCFHREDSGLELLHRHREQSWKTEEAVVPVFMHLSCSQPESGQLQMKRLIFYIILVKLTEMSQ